jgi:peptide/nickel transport system substrate-binding protein
MLAAACLLLAACGGGAPSTAPKQGGTLTTAVGIDADTLDPAGQTTTTIAQIVDMVETLVTIDRQGHIRPLLATSWSESSNGLSWTFTLRRGVRFQDGEHLDAQAVKTSIDRLLSPSTRKALPGALRVIKDVTAVDAQHVRFDLAQPFAPFLAAMTQTQAAILAPRSLNRAPNTPAQVVRPVGTGPYEFKQWVREDHVTMVRFPGYWGRKPSYQTQVYKIVPEAAARESLVKAGQADVAYLPPPNDLPALAHADGVRVVLGPSDRTIEVQINTQSATQPLLHQAAVRQALNYAINRDAIVRNVIFGAGRQDDSTMASSVFGYCAAGDYRYDPARAKRMLQAAGAEGMTVHFISPQGRYIADYDVAQAVAGNLRAVGVNVDLANPIDWPTYIARTHVPPQKATFDMAFNGWAPAFLDASDNLREFEKSNWPPGGSAFSYYDDPQVDQLIARADAESGQSQRKRDFCKAEKTVWSAAPWIFLYTQKNPFITTSKVTGVVGMPNEKFVTTWASPAAS